MQQDFKNAFGTAGASLVTAYTVPANRRALIRTAQISNLTGSSTSGNLSVLDGGTTYRDVSINIPVGVGAAANTLTGALSLKAGDVLQLSSNTSTYKIPKKFAKTDNVNTNTANYAIFSIKYLNGAIVAVGGVGATQAPMILKSTDQGETWTFITMSGMATSGALGDIDFDGTYYTTFVNGVTNTVYTSTDLVTWVSRTITFAATPNAIKFAAGLWVMVGTIGAIVTASNPTGTWTSRTSGLSGTLTCIDYNTTLSLWVVGSSSTTANTQITTAPAAGTTWTAQTTAGGGGIQSIVNNGSRIIAIADTMANSFASTNGSTWNAINFNLSGFPSMGASVRQAAAYAEGKFVTQFTGGFINTSTDGTLWTTIPADGTQIGATTYVAGALNTLLCYTGTNWIAVNSTGVIGKVASLLPTNANSTVAYSISIAEIIL